MRPELERIKQRIRSGDISQEVLDALAKAVPTDNDYEEVMGGAPTELDSFREVAQRIQQIESFVKKPNIDKTGTKQMVRFIDYDGTVIEEVKLSDLPLKKLPKAPNHSGDFIPLTFTGWTATIEKINSTKHNLDVGAQYKSVDEDTHITVHITEDNLDTEKNEITLQIVPIEADILVDFGNGETVTIPAYVPDGNNTPEAVSVTGKYMASGDYDVRISSESQDITLTIQCAGSTDSAIKGAVFGSNVQALGNNTFYSGPMLNYLVIPDSVQSIGNYAFYNCPALTGLVIPNSIQTIGEDTFYCGYLLQSLVIPDSVQLINDYSFYYTYALQSLVIGGSVQSIGNYAFNYCYALETLVLGAQEIGNNVFSSCRALHNLIMEDSVRTIGNYVCSACDSLYDLVIGEGVQTIGSTSFMSGALHSLVIGSSVQSIGSYAFGSCNVLKELIFNEGVETIGDNAFEYCYSLRSVVIPDSVISIGRSAFSNCYALEHLDLGSGVQTIKSYAFNYCYSLKDLIIPDSVQNIESYAFDNCYGIENIVIGDGLQSINSRAFYYCYSLKNLVIGSGVQTIGDHAFYNCKRLESLVIGDGVQTIDHDAFYYSTSLKNLDLGNSVQTIGATAFYECTSIESLVIPDSMRTIGGYVFFDCGLLQNLVIPEGVQTIDSSAFYYACSIKDLVIPDSVQNLGNYSFCHVHALQRLVIGSGVQNVYSGTFSYYGNKAYIKQAPGSLDISLQYAEIEWGYGMDVEGFAIANTAVIYGADTHVKIDYIYGQAEEGEQVFTKGNYELTCSDSATITNGWVRPLVDSGTVTMTVTSTEDPTYSVSKELTIIQPSATVDLNDGQWVDANEEVDGHTVYKSDAGSYHVANGSSVCTIDVIGYSKLKVYMKTDSADNWNDYVVLSYPNQNVTRSSYGYRGRDTSYSAYAYDGLDKFSHTTVQIMYTKNADTDSGGDRGYFYFTVE